MIDGLKTIRLVTVTFPTPQTPGSTTCKHQPWGLYSTSLPVLPSVARIPRMTRSVPLNVFMMLTRPLIWLTGPEAAGKVSTCEERRESQCVLYVSSNMNGCHSSISPRAALPTWPDTTQHHPSSSRSTVWRYARNNSSKNTAKWWNISHNECVFREFK